MTRGLSRRIARTGTLCGALAVLCFAAVSGSEAFAAEGLLFNPTLSLTGKCQAPGTEPDPVPDPGCPGGTHPPKPFSEATSVSTDSYGNVYVASFGHEPLGSEGRIDIFNPEGFFISELSVPSELEPALTVGPRNLAVDSKGNLYVYTFRSGSEERGSVHLCSPVAPYEPAAGNVKYDKEDCKVLVKGELISYSSLEIGPKDHLFMWDEEFLREFSSAAEGNEIVDPNVGEGTLNQGGGAGLAVDLTRKRIYAYDEKNSSYVIKVLELEKPHALLETIDGSTTPAGKFHFGFSIAVDEGTGHVFVFDSGFKGSEAVYELTESGEYLSSIDYELAGHSSGGAEIAIDNGKNSPNGVLNPFGRFLFVPVYGNPVGHSFAFGPPGECAPEIKASAFTGVSESEAELQAEIQPCGLETSYRFEYTIEESFEEEGFAGAQIAGEGQIPAGLAPVSVSAAAEGLVPGANYRFRVFAENEEGSDEVEGKFATYPTQPLPTCPNDALRTGFSALLPDCRAYELVTPPDTNARSPMGMSWFGVHFASRQASPAGDKVSFLIEGGLIPGSEGTGSLGGDTYLATRGENGWSSSLAGPKGTEAEAILPGNTSPDQGYSFWSDVTIGQENYVRYPDGHSALVGRGSLANDPRAFGRLISENGGHIIFVSGDNSSAVQLEEKAPPDGTRTVYDRTANEVTHVVSLLPGDATPAEGENATYQGASLDGKGVAFTIGKKLYLRYNDEETYEIGENATLAGVAEGGARIFYLEGGDLFAFDGETEETIRFTEAGDVVPVNVAAEGTAAYFVSPSVLTGAEENPSGDTAQPGDENLYLSREGAISFVATVTKLDVEGEELGAEAFVGLGLWTDAVGGNLVGTLASDPSRTTPDGNAMLFESRASLTGYDSEGHIEVYRYDSVNDELDCVSCDPTLAPAIGEARLQSISPQRFKPEPLTSYDVVANLRADGRRAFFESTEALVPGDTDELQDVYEWEAQGVGSCANPGGCVYLISSGHSDRIDYLYAVSDDGENVFFRSSDLLLGLDTEHTPSVYDARVEGGFAEGEPGICQGEGCRPLLTSPPVLPVPESGVHEPEGPRPVKHCAKGKRKVVRKGKVHCVKKKHHRRKAGSGRGVVK
jgi:hypothetical protein